MGLLLLSRWAGALVRGRQMWIHHHPCSHDTRSIASAHHRFRITTHPPPCLRHLPPRLPLRPAYPHARHTGLPYCASRSTVVALWRCARLPALVPSQKSEHDWSALARRARTFCALRRSSYEIRCEETSALSIVAQPPNAHLSQLILDLAPLNRTHTQVIWS